MQSYFYFSFQSIYWLLHVPIYYCCYRQDKYENLMRDYEELKKEKMEMDEYHCLELETNKEGMERVEQVSVQCLRKGCDGHIQQDL